MIRKLLIANRGVIASQIVGACRRMGIQSVAVYSDADKQSPHAHLAEEAVALGPSNGPQVYVDAERLLAAARRTGADAVHPGCGFLAANAAFAAACETGGLTFVGPSPDFLASIPKAHEVVQSQGIPPAAEPRDPSGRQIDIQVFGDKHGNVIHFFERDGTIQQGGRQCLCESPAPALDDVLRARLADAAVLVAREMRCTNAATVQFLLSPSGAFSWLGIDPFLSVEHAVSAAATGTDLAELQIAVAEGRFLQGFVPNLRGHAIAAALVADAGNRAAPPRLDVWHPPSATGALHVDAGVVEGMQIPSFDPLLAELICSYAQRGAALRKLSQVLKTLWVGGIATNQALLLRVLESQEFQAGSVHAGQFDHGAVATGDESEDVLFAAAWVLYFENSRLSQRRILPTVGPNYRNNPYRDPFVSLRIGTRTVESSWRHLGHRRYLVRAGEFELDAEVLDLRPGALSVVLCGIMREFQFREIGEEYYVHSPLGTRVVQRLPRSAPRAAGYQAHASNTGASQTNKQGV